MSEIEKIAIDVVCPIYKGYSFLNQLYESLNRQNNVIINRIVLPITDSQDDEMIKIKEFVTEKKIISFVMQKNEFSHSLTREKAIRDYCISPIVVMISQDIKFTNYDVLYNLVKDIYAGNSAYNYARQICKNRTIEKYIREKNYPKYSYYVTSDDINKLQTMAFFASDACSAYDRNIFIKIGGYNGYDVMMSEDMLYSKFILDAGYKKKYCADAIVEHSHKYTLKQLYKRYYDTGIFYSKVKMFDNYKTTNTGLHLAIYVLKKALLNFNIPVLIRWLPDMTSRFLGMKKGRKDGKKI